MSAKEHKKQIWLRPDQCGLVIDCLEFVKNKLGYDLSDGACKMASRYAARQIDDVLKLLKTDASKAKP